MPFSFVNNHAQYYATAGAKNKPALLFSNSLGSDLRIWDSVAEHLSGNFRVVRYDIRGHGLSAATEPPYSADDLAKDVVELFDFLDISQAAVCGVSVGGIIAQAVALNYPERVRALILCDTGARIGSVESWQQRIEMIKTGGIASIGKMTMERWFSTSFRARQPADIRGYASMLLQTSVNGYIGTCHALQDADFRGTAVRINSPTLVLTGAEDVATPPDLGRELASLVPGAQFSLIEGAGHLPCIEQPETISERMLQFFREVHIV
jgi:3-oxoadipate enol-lactonase